MYGKFLSDCGTPLASHINRWFVYLFSLFVADIRRQLRVFAVLNFFQSIKSNETTFYL